MKAGPDASIRNLLAEGRSGGPVVGYARRRRASDDDLGDVLRSEHFLDNTGDSAAKDAVCARVLRVHWRVVDWLPSCLAICIWIGINVAVANCRDWPPEVVMVLGVEHSD